MAQLNQKPVNKGKIANSLAGAPFRKILFLLKYLRFSPYEVMTLDGQSKERKRLLSWAILSSGISKFGSLVLVIASVRWVNEYLSPERFGLWMTITSIVTLLSFVDLGMSNSLVNVISESHGKGDSGRIRKAISSVFITLFALAILCESLLVASTYFIDWIGIFHATEPNSVSEVIPSLVIYFSIFLIVLPFSVVHRVQTGFQEGWRSNLWTIVGQILALIFLALVVNLKLGVPYLILAVAGGPAIATLLNFFIYFSFKRNDIYPLYRVLDRNVFKDVGRVGFLFLIMQFMSLMGNTSDNLIIAKILGLSEVSTYSIVQKLVLILGLSQLFIAPMWPLFGEALARNDDFWAKRILVKMLWLSACLGVLSGLIIIFFGEFIITLWVGRPIEVDSIMLLWFGIFSVLMSLGGSFSVYLNNGHYLKKQIYIYAFASISAIFLKIFFVWYLKNPSGAIIGTTIGYSIFYILPAFMIVFSTNKNTIIK